MAILIQALVDEICKYNSELVLRDCHAFQNIIVSAKREQQISLLGCSREMIGRLCAFESCVWRCCPEI